MRGNFGDVMVVDTATHRLMLLRGAEEHRALLGAEYLADWARDQPAWSGMALMETLAFLRPAPSRVLCLGLGAGTVPVELRTRGIMTDVVERDAAVTALAKKHFAYGEMPMPGKTVHADAFEFISDYRTDSVYDVILSDLFDGSTSRLYTSAHFGRAKRWLRPGGTFALNIVSFYSGPHAALTAAVATALGSTFKHVRAFADHQPTER